jgi:hypothetical protein
MNARTETTIGKGPVRNKDERISESVAEAHARLLGIVGQCLAEVGIRAALTTFHNLVLCGETLELPSRYEPELDVFWPGDRAGIALRVKLIERDDADHYAWGAAWTNTYPANDPAGAVQAIADALLAA